MYIQLYIHVCTELKTLFSQPVAFSMVFFPMGFSQKIPPEIFGQEVETARAASKSLSAGGRGAFRCAVTKGAPPNAILAQK